VGNQFHNGFGLAGEADNDPKSRRIGIELLKGLRDGLVAILNRLHGQRRKLGLWVWETLPFIPL
jgi:hypothetical protein